MMPTFPRPPLRFRKAGFPRYGSKAGLSDRAFPDHPSVKLAPSMPVAWSGLRPSFVLSAAAWKFPVLSRDHLLGGAPPCERHTSLYSRGPRSGRVMLSRPSTLNRPHPPHSRAQPNFIAQRLIWAAFAVRERLGDPRAVPGFRWPFFPDMPSSATPGSST